MRLDLSTASKGHAVAATAGMTSVYIFPLALLAQTFHLIEHAAQVYQHGILGFSARESHGVIFFLDLEWNHFIFNTAYFSLLAIVFLQCRFYRTNGTGGRREYACLAFNIGFLMQGYHVFEHSVRVIQFLQGDCAPPCPGLVGHLFDGVYFHAILNTLVYVSPFVAFVAFGFHKSRSMNSKMKFSFIRKTLFVPIFFLALEVPLNVAKGLWPNWLDIEFIFGLDLIGMIEFTYVSVIGVISYYRGIAWLAWGSFATLVMAVVMLLQIQVPLLLFG